MISTWHISQIFHHHVPPTFFFVSSVELRSELSSVSLNLWLWQHILTLKTKLMLSGRDLDTLLSVLVQLSNYLSLLPAVALQSPFFPAVERLSHLSWMRMSHYPSSVTTSKLTSESHLSPCVLLYLLKYPLLCPRFILYIVQNEGLFSLRGGEICARNGSTKKMFQVLLYFFIFFL